MPDPAKPSAETGPWQVKAFPVELRQKAVRCALKRGEKMGEWLTRAVDAQVIREANDGILPPANAAIPAKQTTPPAVELPAITAAIAVLAEAKDAGLRVPLDVTLHAFAVLRQELRQARGLPPPAPRRPRQTVGQTRPEIGQTIEHSDVG